MLDSSSLVIDKVWQQQAYKAYAGDRLTSASEAVGDRQKSPASVNLVSALGQIEGEGQRIGGKIGTMSRLFDVEAAEDGTVTLNDLETAFDKKAEALGSRAHALLTEKRIPVDGPLDLRIGRSGRIELSGSHPNKTLIERTLNGDQEFRSTFARTEAIGALLGKGRVVESARHAALKSPQDAASTQRWMQAETARLDGGTIALKIEGVAVSANLVSGQGNVVPRWRMPTAPAL